MADKISIITSICKNQKLNDLKDFIESVKFNTLAPYELVIVDNGSDKEVKDYLITIQGPDVLVITNYENFGLGISTDQASHCISTKYLFRLDSDVIIFKKDWDAVMTGILDRNPNIGQIGTPVNSGHVLRSALDHNIVSMIMGCCQCVPLHAICRVAEFYQSNKKAALEKADDWIRKYKGDPDKVRALNLVKKCFMAGEGFHDPGFYYGTDDFDYSLMMRYLGLECASAIGVKIEHRNASMAPEWKEMRNIHVNDGFNYFRVKWELILATLGDNGDLIDKALGSMFGNFSTKEVMGR